MSAKITIRWAVPAGYNLGDYAMLFWNEGSGDIDYTKPLVNSKFPLFPNNGGYLGWYHTPWYHFPWDHGQSSRCSGWYHLPWYHFPWYHGTTVISHNITVDFCGDYKFAFKIFDKLGNENTGTPQEVTASVHIAPPAPTGLKKGTYENYVTVSGSGISPDVSGTYYYDGLYGGYASYKRSDDNYYIYAAMSGVFIQTLKWYITDQKGSVGFFTKESSTPVGAFSPIMFAGDGNPTAAIPGKILTLEAA